MDTSVSKVKSPWGKGTLLAVSFFAGFAACGILAGINWRRLGKPNLMWPTIILSVGSFILYVYFMPENINPSVAIFSSIVPAWGLWWWQRGYYHAWKESHPEAQRAGWQIPTVTALGSLVIMAAIIFMPILVPQKGTQTLLPYSDDFSDPNSGWETLDDEDGKVFYAEGCLHIISYTSAEFATYSWIDNYFTDFVLEVETKLIGGTKENWHIIQVRGDDYWNGYYLYISADGWYGISARTEGSLLSPSQLHTLVDDRRSIHILQGQDATNIVCIECLGNKLRLSVNGNFIEEVTDTRIDGGDIALGALSEGGTFTEIAFDNIVVNAP